MVRQMRDIRRWDRWALLLVCGIAGAGLGGCYDGQEMVDRILQRVADDHLVELDVGTYQVTLPRAGDDPLATTIRVEVVGAVERRNARAVARQLVEIETPLRHATILALRETRHAELLEPDLRTLRERVAAVTAKYLTVAPLRSITFRSFAVYED